MSVLACSRTGCSNVMCDVILEGYGNYICNDCLEEMKSIYGENPTLSEVNDFMATSKTGSEQSNLEKAYEEINLICKKYDVRIEWMDFAWCSLTDGLFSIPIKRCD